MPDLASLPIRVDTNTQHGATEIDDVLATTDHHNENSAIMANKMTAPTLGGDLDISAGQKMLSAVSGSLLTSLLVTPLDVVRVRQQSQPRPPRNSFNASALPSKFPNFSNLPPNLGVTACCREVFWVNNASPYCIASTSSTLPYTVSTTPLPSSPATVNQTADCAVDQTRRKTFNSTFDGLQKIARNEGLTSLWRGLSPTLVMAVPANVIYFTGYDALRHNVRSPVRKYVSDSYAPLLAGSIARVAAAATISPIEMFRTRMQASTTGSGPGVFAHTLGGLKKMVESQGYTSLWRGLTLTMWRDVPFSGIYWWGYEAVRDLLTEIRDLPVAKSQTRAGRDHAHASTFVDSFIAGATSGAVASIITTPFDVGKTRQQVLEHKSSTLTSSSFGSSKMGKPVTDCLRPEERSMPRFLYLIWKEEGTAGLFRGWVARVLKVAPACAIMISSYEVGKKMARTMNERERQEALG